MTIEQFAFHCDLHPAYCGGLERGERNISLASLRKLAIGLGIDPGELLPPLTGDERKAKKS